MTKRAALTYFEWGWDHTPVLPSNQNLGTIHAAGLSRANPRSNEPLFLEFEYERAICGETVKVILANKFHPDEANACRKCADLVQAETETTR